MGQMELLEPGYSGKSLQGGVLTLPIHSQTRRTSCSRVYIPCFQGPATLPIITNNPEFLLSNMLSSLVVKKKGKIKGRLWF